AVADGPGVGTLTAFSGAAPTGDSALDCANRVRGTAVGLTVRARAGEPLWLRIGSDATDAPAATLTVERAPAGANAVSGTGPGGGTRPGTGSATCTDRTAPTLRLTGGGVAALRATKRRPTLRGTATDKGCTGAKVRRIQVALQRKSGKTCQAVGTTGKPGKRRSCTRVTWLTAKGTTSWRLTLKRKLPTGTYVLRIRARDAAGNASKTTRSTFTVGRKTRT
ncbi:MAG TPA: Ig-like domain-containing protein, partial [Solirubrobacteraceae bacterium]|nr:Ig-like domain-containing protein [Solirubrobacteraceae bacterium]